MILKEFGLGFMAHSKAISNTIVMKTSEMVFERFGSIASVLSFIHLRETKSFN